MAAHIDPGIPDPWGIWERGVRAVVKYWRRRRLHEREDVIRDELQGREGNEDGDEVQNRKGIEFASAKEFGGRGQN